MIALVTGAAGFIGSHLVERLLRDGHRVIGVDDLSTGSLDNMAFALGHEAFTFIEADICAGLPWNQNVDRLFHFASPASPLDYAARPLETMRVNAVGTDRCCELASAVGARLIYASTSEVYGDPAVHPQSETYFGNVNPNGPRSCYDEGKRYGEAMVAAYQREYGLDARIVRIFNTYGPRMRRNDGRVVPAFVTQALEGAPLTVFGDGRQTRCLCYVDDLVDGILAYAGAGALPFDVMNLGSDHEVSVLEIARTISEACGAPLRIEYRPLPHDDPRQRRPDLQRSRTFLNWSPRIALEVGLSRTISFFTDLTKEHIS